MVFSICGQSVGEFRGHSPWWVINPKVDCTSIELQPVQVMDWQQNEAFIHAYCLVSPYIWKMQPTHFEWVACMVLFKIPWRSYGNWDVDPSKVTGVGMLARGLVVFNSWCVPNDQKMPTHVYWFFLSRWRLIPLLFPWRIRGDPSQLYPSARLYGEIKKKIPPIINALCSPLAFF